MIRVLDYLTQGWPTLALFFDQTWFDKMLQARGATRGDVARLLGINDEAVNELWKDQRELSATDVASLATFFGVAADTIAHHAGISTPVPTEAAELHLQLKNLNQRIDRIERLLIELRAIVDRSLGIR